MKLGILSASLKCYSTRRLREAAEQRDHKVAVLNTNKFAIDLEQGEPDLYFRQKQNVLIQTFVAESKGRDIRAFVVGDRVVAAMRRVAQG